MTIQRNEAGDRLDGLKDAPLPPPPPPAPRGLPAGAIGRNENGDPIFPVVPSERNEAGDLLPVASAAAAAAPARQLCQACGGRGKWMEKDYHKVLQPVVCQKCDGTKLQR